MKKIITLLLLGHLLWFIVIILHVIEKSNSINIRIAKTDFSDADLIDDAVRLAVNRNAAMLSINDVDLILYAGDADLVVQGLKCNKGVEVLNLRDAHLVDESDGGLVVLNLANTRFPFLRAISHMKHRHKFIVINFPDMHFAMKRIKSNSLIPADGA
jgi:sulfur transfer complex TusBCD TusB component (DsrH family)